MIKTILNIGFRFVLSLSLIFVPTYGYSTVETLIGRLEEEYRRTQQDVPEEFQEASQILTEMGTALTENRLKEYIDARPELKNKFDVLSLSNQRLEVLDYAEKPVYVIHFDNENSGSRSYTRVLTNIDVDFNEEGKLVFKGIVVSEDKKNKLEKRVGLVHTFEDIKKEDVIDWAYDKEFLVILHRSRGFILYHTMFAQTLLGSAPIPSINFPAPNLSHLRNVRLEFIDRAIAPTVEPAGHSDVAVNLDGKPMFIAGDLLVSYDNSEDQKSTARVLSRSKDLVNGLFGMYETLGALIQIRDLTNNSDLSNSFYLERHFAEIVQTVLSATLNRNPVSFFGKFSDLINIIPYFLLYTYIHKTPDKFLHTEWYADYQKIRESSPELFEQRSKEEGKTISSVDIAKALQPVVAVKEEKRKSRFQKWKNNLKEKYPNLKENGINTSVGVLAGLLAVFESFRIPHTGEGMSYMSNTIYEIVFLGVGFILIIGVSGRLSIPILKGVRKLLPGELKLTVEQIIEKWGGDNIRVRDRIAAFGFMIAGALLPLIYRAFQIPGQHHLFSTLTRGLNPFRKITPDSSLGRAVGLEYSALLGPGLPRWTGENYKKKSQLIDLVNEEKKRVNRLSRIMAYYALSGQEFDIRVVLTGLLALNDNFDYTDKRLQLNLDWVSQKLSRYILKSRAVDTSLPVFEWDIRVINNDINQEALSLAQKVQSISWTQKQIREWGKTTAQQIQRGLAWNTEYAKVLMSYYPERAVGDQFWHGLILDHLAFSTFPLTSFTPRGDFYGGSIDAVAIESHTFFRSNPLHMHEAALNVAIHDVQSARQQLQFLVLRKNEKLKKLFEELAELYNPVEEHLNITNNNPGFWQYIKDLFKYPFNWGQRIYEGLEQEERVDAGWQLWKTVRISFRFWAVTIPLGILSRETFAPPELSLYSNIIGTLYFAGAGLLIFGLPQIWAMHHHLIFTKRSKETKEIINRIKLTDRQIRERLYTSSKSLDEDYERALYSFKKLYDSSKKAQRTISLDQMDPTIKEFILQSDFEMVRLREFIQSQTLGEKREEIRIISSLLNTRYLPTQVNEAGYQVALLLGLAIFSNIVFVYVSDKSFRNTFFEAVYWISAMAISGYGYNLLSAKNISDRMKSIKRGAKGMGTGIKRRCSSAFRSLRLRQ